MRLAVHVPKFLFFDRQRDFLGYAFAFFKKYRPILYFPSLKRSLLGGRGFEQLIRSKAGEDTVDLVYSMRELNRRADVLISFNDFPYLPERQPPRKFQGLKVWHVMDYVFRPREACEALTTGGVDTIMGYADHGRYCPFFREFYAPFVDRLIPVPFGFGDRFKRNTPFPDRIPKAIALGSVNPVDDPQARSREDLADYIRFFRDHTWTHRWRRALVEHRETLAPVMDSQLPVFPETKNPEYDAVEMLNRYAFFPNDEGLMQFPPARTYEGMAAGALLVGNDHPCYRDIGLRDGVNCVLHPSRDVTAFRERLEALRNSPAEAERLAEAGYRHVRKHFSHQAVAEHIHRQVAARYAGKPAPQPAYQQPTDA
ncbi:MAG: glycosyltransferase [Opitutales bacterium]